MLRCFFEKRDEDLSHLFEGLAVWRAGEHYRAEFQRYPVIHLTLENVKHDTFEQCWKALREKVDALYDEHRYLLSGGQISEREAREYESLLKGTADQALYYGALANLSALLHRHHGEKVVILIDEYDKPFRAGYIHGYLTQAIDNFTIFLTSGLKDNPHLHRAMIAGVLCVPMASTFSGLDNVAAYSLLRPEFSTCFGFTAPEVAALLDKAGRLDLLDPICAAYNGYLFGGTAIYNPWSLLSCLQSGGKMAQSNSGSTSSNELIKDLIQHHTDTEEDFAALLEGGEIERRLSENVLLQDLQEDERALWSLLVFLGYLRAEPGEAPPHEVPPYRLSIPNPEVREVYTSTFRG